MVHSVDSLVTNNKRLGYGCKEEFFYEAAVWRLEALNENIENLEVSKTLYSQAETAIKEMDLPYTSVDDFVEEQMKNLHKQHDQ